MNGKPDHISLPFTIGQSPTLHIRGIIASRTIRKHEIIERCPVILVPVSQSDALFATVLQKYYYEWDGKNHCIVLGYGSLINHSFTPNARYTYSFPTHTLIYRAIRGISPGEEITVNYNYEPDNMEPLDPFLVDFNSHQPRSIPKPKRPVRIR